MPGTSLTLNGPVLRLREVGGTSELQESWREIEPSCSPDTPMRDPQPKEDKEKGSWVSPLPCSGALHRLINKVHPRDASLSSCHSTLSSIRLCPSS